MIKFTVLTEENERQLIEKLRRETGADAAEISDILDSLLDMTVDESDIEVGLCSALGCVLVRVFDMGRYMFPYPIAVVDGADEQGAVELIREYAVKEEIGLTFTDVPRECVGYLATGLRHTVIDAENGGESFRVAAESECSLLDVIPEISVGELSLTALLPSDAEHSAALNRDAEINRYWGYDFREDNPSATDEYFIEMAEREFGAGVAMTLAVRLEGEYIGEAVLYGFDLKGGAEVGIRLLREYHGRGLGKATLEALVELAREVGLIRLMATIDRRNTVSTGLFSSCFDEIGEGDGVIHYEYDLLV